MASDGRLRRFLHLERARPAGPTAEPSREQPGGTEERFGGMEQPRAPSAHAPRTRTGAQLERFGPEPEPRLELVDANGRRPFVRCRRCGMDSNVFATACQGCGVSLDTPEQHDFDERFWIARQAEAEREERDAAARRELQARAEAEDAGARRAMGEAIAREVGESERRRLDGRLGRGGSPDEWSPLGRGSLPDEWSPLGGGGSPGEWSPLGLRLVRRLIPDERWHIPVMALAAGLSAALAGFGIHLRSALVGIAGAAALVLLLVNAPE
jgi:hypothetical protein